MKSLLWTFLILGVVLVAGLFVYKLLAKPPAYAPGTGPGGNVLAPVNGVLGWINQAAGTASTVAGSADRVLTSAESIYDRLSHWGEGDTGDN